MTLTMNQPIAQAQGSPHSLTPVRTKGSEAGTLAGPVLPLGLGFNSKECAMGAENPLLNFRVPIEIKDALSLHAGREGQEVGPMLRNWMSERLAVERVTELLKSVGLIEVLRRLSMPSSIMANSSSTRAECTGQTSGNLVRQDEELVLQEVAPGATVLHVKRSNRG